MSLNCVKEANIGAISPIGKLNFWCFTPTMSDSFDADVKTVLDELEYLRGEYGEVLWLKFHLSDISRQADRVRELLKGKEFLVSMVGQPPVEDARLAVEAWLIKGNMKLELKEEPRYSALKISGEHYQWGLFRLASVIQQGSYDQSMEEFNQVQRYLKSLGGTVSDHLLRTWIYCRDVDNQYEGLVDARNCFFQKQGMTRDTHFIASTGIEGLQAQPSRYIGMDSLFFFGLQESQIQYMSADDFLPPTHHYGVAFERGTRLTFGDFSLYFISGTASIDAQGDVMYIGDAASQAMRAIANMEALMRNHQGGLSDFVQLVVYLRDAKDAKVVREVIENSKLSHCPYIMVAAAVCRPTWLVEMEAIAVNDKGDGHFAPFA